MKKRIIPIAAVLVSAAFFIMSCATVGEVNNPEITVDAPSNDYISPAVSEGVRDEFVARFSIVAPEGSYIESYVIARCDQDGDEIYTIKEDNLETERLVEQFTFTGKIATEDEYFSDGEYSLIVKGSDSEGRTVQSEVIDIFIDNSPPRAELSLPYTLFSPNGDGNKDRLLIRQVVSNEDTWSASIVNEDDLGVKNYEWDASVPRQISWDGTDDEGEALPDGEYRYVLQTTDMAGNSVREISPLIRLNTANPTVSVSRNYQTFSPNEDGRKDSLKLTLSIPRAFLVDTWAISVLDETGTELWLEEREGSPPSSYGYEGKDNNGNTLSEGRYQAELSVLYKNGSRASAESKMFRIDLSPPSASVSAEFSVFSPNGDGNKDVQTIIQSAEDLDTWSGEIRTGGGETIRKYTWHGTVPDQVIWKGRSDNGEVAADGSYIYVLSGTDTAGNKQSVSTDSFRLDTSAVPEIGLTLNRDAFSPNDDGTKEQIRARPHVKSTEGLVKVAFRVFNQNDELIYSQSQEELPDSFTWEGNTNTNEEAGGGTYQAELALLYRNGNAPSAMSDEFIIDVTDPSINLSADYTLFSPDGDGNRDSITIKQSSSSENNWHGRIVNTNGNVVVNRYWEGKAENFTWDGRNEEGELVPNGNYNYVISSTDQAGNSLTKRLETIRVDYRQPSIHIAKNRQGFSPNGDEKLEEIDLDLYTDIPEGIENWSVRIEDADGNEIQTFSGSGEDGLPATITWSPEPGEIEDGEYMARLALNYIKGNEARASLEEAIIVDTRAPRISAQVEPLPFSPDDDGYHDSLSINMNLKDMHEVETWSITITDPGGNTFKTYSGSGMEIDTIVWNGTSEEGELVQSAGEYLAKFSATDVFRNTNSVTEIIDVGILVQEENGKLFIRVPNIHFVPFEADFRNLEDRDKVEQNMRTLDRLANILSEYPDYDIRIEGHAVLIQYWNEELADQEQEEVLLPLSKERAEVIKDALAERGIESERMTTKGFGGSEPIVPHSNFEERWKNRRVEFVLTERSQ